MRIAITGASGMIGSALARKLEAAGHAVLRLSHRAGAGDALFDPLNGRIDADRLEGLDAVVHLAAENIAGARWTDERKRLLRDSRVQGTQLLVEALLARIRRPAVLLSASATGIYGDRGDEELDEGSAIGDGFLPDLCRDWEAATKDAQYGGIRVAHLRFGVVLSRRGGAVAKMLLPFRLGLGGRLGSGAQWMPWIGIDDAVAAIELALHDPLLSGPVNVVAPPVTNAQFTAALGRALQRPAFLAVPEFALRLLFGEMGPELMLASHRVLPRRLLAAGFRFRHEAVEDALRAALLA